MHVIGDPTQLVEQFQTGFVELITITRDEIVSRGQSGVGRGIESLVKNVVGGFFDSIGKATGSVADILDATALGDVSKAEKY